MRKLGGSNLGVLISVKVIDEVVVELKFFSAQCAGSKRPKEAKSASSDYFDEPCKCLRVNHSSTRKGMVSCKPNLFV